ncbi:MAG TPA: R3H domain-containing nucleic acid-binding protein [Candidatus Saccharimonadales bacterium]|nr:R3H domain-containing nucleic acid-binding protein [Candidatus Saccharimonadales bacterium]
MDRDASIAYAKKYLEDLLSFFGLNTDVAATCEEDVVELRVPSTHLNGFLIGQRGDTLRSLQFLVSMGLKNQEAELNRVNVDIADYKRHRADRLAEQVAQWCEEVLKSKQPMELRPMSPADRRVVHRTVSEYGDLKTESVGEGRDRHIVLSLKEEGSEAPESAEALSDDAL